jgi:SynChlorMet cassette protein ScmD
MKNADKPIADPVVMLREEFDDWAVLFDPDTCRGFGLSPTGVYVWKLLDGEHSISDMLKALHQDALDVPEEAGEHLVAFVETLAQHGLAACEAEQVRDYRGLRRPRSACAPENVPDAMQFIYEPPQLVDLRGNARADGTCYYCTDGTGASSGCTPGGAAAYGCISNGSGVQYLTGPNSGDCTFGYMATCECNSTGAFAAGDCVGGTATYH